MNYRKVICFSLSVAFALLLLSLTGCGSRRDVPVSGPVRTKTVQGEASSLTVENIFLKTGSSTGGPQVELLSDGGAKRAEIEAQESLLDVIVVKFSGSSLRIVAAQDSCYLVSEPVKIRLYNYDFEKMSFAGACQVTAKIALGSPEKELGITMSGASSLNAEKIEALKLTADFSGASTAVVREMRLDRFKLDVSGASSFRCENCTVAAKCDWNLSGASTLKLAGTGNDLFAVVNGASRVESFDFEQQTCIITVSGASTMELNMVKSLGGSILRGSTVTYQGDPETATEIGSTGKLVKK